MSRTIRVAILADYAEENWPSMDLVAGMLFEALRRGHHGWIEPVLIRPAFVRRFSRAGEAIGKRFNLDRLINRLVHYPSLVRRIRDQFDLIHVIDHSYSHLVHSISADRAIVTCHDLNTFRCVLEPASEPRSWPFRKMAEWILQGLRRAAAISCDTEATRAALLSHGIASEARARTIHIGIARAYSADGDPGASSEAERILGPVIPEVPEVLHVGSTVGRKRIDVLLRVFAGLRGEFAGARLVHVGGPFTAAQRALAANLGLGDHVVETPFLEARVLAAIYRRAALVLLPSEAEGFGLPLAEAMASGAIVLASDIPAFREVGAGAAHYAPVGDVSKWIDAAAALLRERTLASRRALERRAAGIERAAAFSWDEAAATTAHVYAEMLGRCERIFGGSKTEPMLRSRGKELSSAIGSRRGRKGGSSG